MQLFLILIFLLLSVIPSIPLSFAPFSFQLSLSFDEFLSASLFFSCFSNFSDVSFFFMSSVVIFCYSYFVFLLPHSRYFVSFLSFIIFLFHVFIILLHCFSTFCSNFQLFLFFSYLFFSLLFSILFRCSFLLFINQFLYYMYFFSVGEMLPFFSLTINFSLNLLLSLYIFHELFLQHFVPTIPTLYSPSYYFFFHLNYSSLASNFSCHNFIPYILITFCTLPFPPLIQDSPLLPLSY